MKNSNAVFIITIVTSLLCGSLGWSVFYASSEIIHAGIGENTALRIGKTFLMVSVAIIGLTFAITAIGLICTGLLKQKEDK